jgi:hypothetical protein
MLQYLKLNQLTINFISIILIFKFRLTKTKGIINLSGNIRIILQ